MVCPSFLVDPPDVYKISPYCILCDLLLVSACALQESSFTFYRRLHGGRFLQELSSPRGSRGSTIRNHLRLRMHTHKSYIQKHEEPLTEAPYIVVTTFMRSSYVLLSGCWAGAGEHTCIEPTGYRRAQKDRGHNIKCASTL